MAKFGSALVADKFEAQQMIQEAIENSINLAQAMECVGAMYGIPSSNILIDDKLKSVKVINDNIVCPSNVSAKNNENTIVRSIGAVLDQISSRIDDKLNGIQTSNIEQGRESDEVASKSDPSKGKVVATYKDANGDILLVYDSGIIDAPQTPEGRAKANEIRAAGNAPTLNPLPKNTPSYFSDEDNVMNGVNDTPEQPAMEYSLADMISEESYFLDAMAKFGDTPNLGHAILTYHGYECVQPTMNLVQEADSSTGGKKTFGPDDVKYMKFDNSEIYKAIECLNKARASQDFIKHVEDIDVEALIRNKDYQDAIHHLEKQFDCKLSIKWMHAGKNDSQVHTIIYPSEYRTRMTVSKSKGFQLGGAPIRINIVEDGITELITNRQDLFGQAFISIILHEIFHNIAGIMRYENAQFVATMTVAMDEAVRTRDPNLRRMVIEKYVDSLNGQMGGKINRVTKRLLVKRFLALAAAEGDVKMMSQYQDALDNDSENNKVNEEANNRVKRAIKIYKAGIKAAEKPVKRAKGRGITGMILGGLAIVASVLGVILISSSFMKIMAIAIGLGGIAGITIGAVSFASIGKYKKIMKKYKNSKDMEEYYADLMSAMYQLPQHFFIGGNIGGKRYQFNEIERDTMEEWVKVEKIFADHCESDYPTPSERTWTGVVIAKKLLEECPHLDKNVKKYLKWIVDNNDQLMKSGIGDQEASHSFDPKEAQDLDKHVSSMISNNKVTVTEAAIKELADSSEFAEWLEQGMVYTEDELAYQEECEMMYMCDDFYQELYTSRRTTGYADESLLKRILMFIPRLLMNCLEVVFRFLRGVGNSLLDEVYKIFTPNKVYKIDFDVNDALRVMQNHEILVNELYEHLKDVKTLEEFVNKCGTLYDVIHEKATSELQRSVNFEKLGEEGYSKWQRFESAHGEPFKHDKADITITGKQLANTVIDIHKIGTRITPKLRRLIDQTKRLTKPNKESDKPVEKLTRDQKRTLNIMIGVYRHIYMIYNSAGDMITDFRRKKATKDEIKEDLESK